MSILSKNDSFHDSGKAFSIQIEGLALSCRHFSLNNHKKLSFIYCHGIQDHQIWFTEAAEELKDMGFTVYTWDRIGSGKSALIDDLRGHMDAFAVHLKSLEAVIEKARTDYPENKIVLWGEDYGAKLLAALAGTGTMVDGLIFSTPLFETSYPRCFFSKNKSYHPSIVPEISGDNGASVFTAHEAFFLKIKNDHQSLRSFTRKFYLESERLDRFIQKKTKNISLPSLVLLIGDDSMVDNKKIQKFFKERFKGLELKIYQTDKKKQHRLMFTSAKARALHDINSFTESLK